jgi:hypothetical protein
MTCQVCEKGEVETNNVFVALSSMQPHEEERKIAKQQLGHYVPRRPCRGHDKESLKIDAHRIQAIENYYNWVGDFLYNKEKAESK